MSTRLHPILVDSQYALAKIEKLKLQYPLDKVNALLHEGDLLPDTNEEEDDYIISCSDLWGFHATPIGESDDIRYQILINLWLQDPWSKALPSALALFELFGLFPGCIWSDKGLPYNDFGLLKSRCVLMRHESAKRFGELLKTINFELIGPIFHQNCKTDRDGGYEFRYYRSVEDLRYYCDELASLFSVAANRTSHILYIWVSF